MTTIHDDVRAAMDIIARATYRASFDLAQQAEGLVLLRAPEGVEPLLRELAAADRDMGDHWKRWAHEAAVPHEKRSEECRNDWARALRRHEWAVAALTRLAKALPAEPDEAAKARAVLAGEAAST